MVISQFFSRKKALLALVFTATVCSQLAAMNRSGDDLDGKDPVKKAKVQSSETSKAKAQLPRSVKPKRLEDGSVESLISSFIRRIASQILQTGDLELYHALPENLQDKVIHEFIDASSYGSFFESLCIINRLNVLTFDRLVPIVQCHFNDIAITGEQLADFLRTACICSHVTVVKMIFAVVGHDVVSQLCAMRANDEYTDSALDCAIKSGCLEIVKLILALPNAPALCARSPWTALHYAAMYGHTEIAKLILGKIPNPIGLCVMQDNMGRTPLHFAAQNGMIETVKFFLTLPYARRLCSMQDNGGNTPLHYAACNGQVDIVEAFLNMPYAREFCFIPNNAGIFPLGIAEEVLAGHDEARLALVKAAFGKKYLLWKITDHPLITTALVGGLAALGRAAVSYYFG